MSSKHKIESFLKDNMSYMLSQCYRLTKDKEEANLILSTSIESIWRHRNNFHGNFSEFKAWATRIIRNNFINEYRLKKKRKPHVEVDDSFNLGSRYSEIRSDESEILDRLFSMIEKEFNKDIINTFKLHVLDGMKYQDIADHINRPIGTVKNRIHQVRSFCIKNKHIIES